MTGGITRGGGGGNRVHDRGDDDPDQQQRDQHLDEGEAATDCRLPIAYCQLEEDVFTSSPPEMYRSVSRRKPAPNGRNYRSAGWSPGRSGRWAGTGRMCWMAETSRSIRFPACGAIEQFGRLRE